MGAHADADARSDAMPWGEVGSLVYFAAVAAVVFVAAMVDINRRDP